jgi:hypothetical protein
MSQLPTTTLYVPSDYQKFFCKLNNRLQTEVMSFTVTRTDGGTAVHTNVKDYAGRQKGAAMSTGTIKMMVPYILTDASGGGGQGFSSAGIVTGDGFQLDQTMLTSQNQNANMPITILGLIGQPAAQKITIVGYITSITVDYADGKLFEADCTFEGQFNTFQ